MKVFVLLAVCCAAVAALPAERIAGGAAVPIESHPSAVALLYTQNWFNYLQSCGGVIINSRSVLTGGVCAKNDPANRWRARIGSTFPNHGGEIYLFQTIIVHPEFDLDSLINDVAIMRTNNPIAFSNVASAAAIAGTNYNLGDNTLLTAVGWGQTMFGGSEQLRRVEVQIINHSICASRYITHTGITVTNDMFCSGWLDQGWRDTCRGDEGGPLYHNNVVYGIFSFNNGCGSAFFPSVNTRVPAFSSWIQANA
ncbi:trypsin, alkaline A-like [Trichoplusia ni]|uniref:Trypsin, alkaline A-like n=1 Tax=Trichoplusia ni TaxID=7111 RepID=A0A7E5WFB2_TRINI|nr:trypsin, alkaline A-like [Trichoplusia ni]